MALISQFFDSLVSQGRIVLLGLVALGLAACGSGGGSNDVAPVETTTVQGQVINGPLVGAEVHIYDSEGKLLGSTRTDEHGDYELEVAANPPYRIVTQGGLLNGVAYLGSMQAWCTTDILCDATPFTTALLAVMERMELNQDDAMYLLAGMLGIEFDPFTDPNTPPGSFPLDDVRAAIGNGGVNLEFWVGSVADWAENPSQPAPGGLQSYSVTPSAGTGGSISPNTAQNVNHGATTSFTFAPDTGYSIDTVGGCDGSLVGDTYTTGAITADCTVTASFNLNSYTVTPSAGANGSISPDTAQAVNHGATTSFTLAPNTGYSIDTVGGTCGGSLVGNTYTTGAITADCTVTASFSLNSYTVTPSAGTGGSINPSTAQTINHGMNTSFIITPDTGYSIDEPIGGTCVGALADSIYTIPSVTSSCAFDVTFTKQIASYTVSTSSALNGDISPSSQIAIHGEEVSFVISPNYGYVISGVTGCDGVLIDNVFITSGIIDDCIVSAEFETLIPVGTWKYIHPSSENNLLHEWEAAPYPTGHVYKMPVSSYSSIVIYGYDDNRHVNRRITISNDSEEINLLDWNISFGALGYISHNTVDSYNKRLVFTAPHRSEDKLLFSTVAAASDDVKFTVLDFSVDLSNKGKWNYEAYPDFIIFFRISFDEAYEPIGVNEKFNIELYKVDYNGDVISSRMLLTSNIPDTGYMATNKTSHSSPYATSHIEASHHNGSLILRPFGALWNYDGVNIANAPLVAINTNTLELTHLFQQSNFVLVDGEPDIAGINIQKLFDMRTHIMSATTNPQYFGGWFSDSTETDLQYSKGWISGVLADDYDRIDVELTSLMGMEQSEFNYFLSHDKEHFIYGAERVIDGRRNRIRGIGNKFYELPSLLRDNCAIPYFSSVTRMGPLDFDSVNCGVFNSYYSLSEVNGIVGVVVPDNYHLSDQDPSPSTSSSSGRGSIRIKSSSSYIAWIELDNDNLHPECTSFYDVPMPQVEIKKKNGTVPIQKWSIPDSIHKDVITSHIVIDSVVTPVEHRAPVLCSPYKINIDQFHVTKGQWPITPRFHSSYSLSAVNQPSNGAYDQTSNRYTANEGFRGIDNFSVEIDDGTGQQVVFIEVLVD